MHTDPETLRKAILYKAKHRGSKEADLWIFGFVQETLPELMNDQTQLSDLYDFVNQDDHMLFEKSLTESPPPIAARFSAYVRAKNNL